MYISRLALDHYRSWEHCVLDFKPGINILQGANGLGKTKYRGSHRSAFHRIQPSRVIITAINRKRVHVGHHPSQRGRR